MKSWMKDRISKLTPREHLSMALVFALMALVSRIVGLEFWCGALQYATCIRLGVVMLGYRWKVWEDA